MGLDEPILTEGQRRAINAGRWFAALSPTLRHDLLRHGRPRRLVHGEFLFARGEPASGWCAVAAGALRLSCTTLAERPVTLCFLGPGLWLADFTTVEGGERLYDAQAHGPTTVLELVSEAVQAVLRQHRDELYDAMLRLHAGRTRQLFALVEDLQTLPVMMRLARQLVHLARQFGAVQDHAPGEIRIRLRLSQDDLAQLVAASRQRLNHELSCLAAQGIVRVEPRQVVICDAQALSRIAGLPLAHPRPAVQAPRAPAVVRPLVPGHARTPCAGTTPDRPRYAVAG